MGLRLVSQLTGTKANVAKGASLIISFCLIQAHFLIIAPLPYPMVEDIVAVVDTTTGGARLESKAGAKEKSGGKVEKKSVKNKPYSNRDGKAKSLSPPLSVIDGDLSELGGVLLVDSTHSNPDVVAGLLECVPVNSGLGAVLSAPVLQDPLGPVSYILDQHCAEPNLLSKAEALALFQATLSVGPLPVPVINFDEDALITTLIKDMNVSVIGGKFRKLRNKKGKKLIPKTNSDEAYSDEDSPLEALMNPNLSPGDIERRFGRCVARNARDIT